MNYRASIFPSLKRRGGCAVKKYREATLVRADGVVRPAKVYRPEASAGLTTRLRQFGSFAIFDVCRSDRAFFLESGKYARHRPRLQNPSAADSAVDLQCEGFPAAGYHGVLKC